jgi:PKD repeat protein
MLFLLGLLIFIPYAGMGENKVSPVNQTGNSPQVPKWIADMSTVTPSSAPLIRIGNKTRIDGKTGSSIVRDMTALSENNYYKGNVYRNTTTQLHDVDYVGFCADYGGARQENGDHDIYVWENYNHYGGYSLGRSYQINHEYYPPWEDDVPDGAGVLLYFYCNSSDPLYGIYNMTWSGAPIAQFTYTPHAGLEPLTVMFTDTSRGDLASFFWDFGDGATSTERYPSHQYAAPGTYTVTHSATNNYGTSWKTISNAVTVFMQVPISGGYWYRTEVKSDTIPQANATSACQYGFGLEHRPCVPGEKCVEIWEETVGHLAYAYSLNFSQPWTGQMTGVFYPIHLSLFCFNGDTYRGQQEYENWRLNMTLWQPSPPVVSFAATPRTGQRPLTVNFSDTSKYATSWLWDFGDGNTTTVQNPLHTYPWNGNFTVNLTATNYLGRSSAESYIAVGSSDPPVANFSGTPLNGSMPLGVQFTDLSTNSPTSWFWNFDDGVNSTEQNPSHTFTCNGAFNVSLTAINNGGSATEMKENYVRVRYRYPPIPQFSGDPQTGSAPLTAIYR